jgi:hypothetical protein
MIDSQGRDGPSRVLSQIAPLPDVSQVAPLSTVSQAAPIPATALATVTAPAPDAPAKTRTADLEPLGFKVPPQFNQEFRRFAFENGYKLNELLFAAFESFKKARIRESANS